MYRDLDGEVNFFKKKGGFNLFKLKKNIGGSFL